MRCRTDRTSSASDIERYSSSGTQTWAFAEGAYVAFYIQVQPHV